MAMGCAVQTSCTSRTVRKVQKGFGQGRAVLWVCVGKEKLYALTLGGTGGLNLFEHKGKAALEQSSQQETSTLRGDFPAPRSASVCRKLVGAKE